MASLRLAFLWHMHQPFYLDAIEGRFTMPWVRLHSIKDYLDMPLLAAEAGLRMNFNLVPSLLEQWEAWRRGSRDPVQDLCDRPVGALAPAEREELASWLFRAHPQRMIQPFADYAACFRRWQASGHAALSDEELARLKFWFHLAWLDPLFRGEAVPAAFLAAPERMNDAHWPELRAYLDGFPERLAGGYRRLHGDGAIEVSVSPFYHPILPLLVDQGSAREAQPEIQLPQLPFAHAEDARWHLREAREAARRWLDLDVRGLWPSEGSVSDAALAIAAEEGFAWAASDEQVLARCLGLPNLQLPGAERAALLYRPRKRRYPHGEIALVFRDHFLSDRIGFSYASWEPAAAVEDFIGHLRRIRQDAPQEEPLVSVILDGENCWEYYPDDGLPFLRALYARLAEERWIRVGTVSEHLAALESPELPRVAAGSWIDGNFAIWIGHEEDNRSWDYLAKVRRDLVAAGGGFHPLQGDGGAPGLRKAWGAFFVAEGSDWNWWYGEDHSSLDDERFDALYRSHLSAVYAHMEQEPPGFLLEPVSRRRGRRGALIPIGLSAIELDGEVSHFYEWANGARFSARGEGGAMTRVDHVVEELWLAFGREDLFLRVDFAGAGGSLDAAQRLSLDFRTAVRRRFRIDLRTPGSPVTAEEALADGWRALDSAVRWSRGRILEISIPWRELPASAGQDLYFALTFLGEAGILEHVPAGHLLIFSIPDPDYDRVMWNV